mmetsp:Transcript_16885/g.25416  ORF Transcript_16885/g.25416 Transcript_16885/m.25416 type:complete len:256 (+) Transcript_16885:24-791(+)
MLLLRYALAEAVAGSAGGAAKTIATYPFDLATTRRECGLEAFAPLNEEINNWRDCYFRGLLTSLILVIPYALIFHFAYVLGASNIKSQIKKDLIGSAIGSLAASVVGVPSECAKKRIQLGATPRSALSGGISLFDGYLALLLRNVPYNSMNFGTFSLISRLVPNLPSAFAGAIAGLCTAAVTHPLDVILTRIQTSRLSTTRQRPSSLLQVALSLDFPSLFRGLFVRLLSYAPASLIFFSVFDPVRSVFYTALCLH